MLKLALDPKTAISKKIKSDKETKRTTRKIKGISGTCFHKMQSLL